MENHNDRILQESIRINEGLINMLILITGLLLIVIGSKIPKDSNWNTAAFGIGCSLTASAVVMYLNAKYTLKRLAEEIVTKEWGLCAIYPSRQEMNVSCDIALRNASDRIDMTGFGFRSLRDSQDAVVKDKVKRGTKIRVISMDPSSAFLAQREKDEKVSSGSIRDSILQLDKWIEDLRNLAPNKDNVQIKYYNSLPQDFYFRADDHVYVGPYLYGKQSQQTISYEYAGKTKGFEHYTSYFENLWQDESFCHPGIRGTKIEASLTGSSLPK